MKALERIKALVSDGAIAMVRGEDENSVFFVNREEVGSVDNEKILLHRAALKRVYSMKGDHSFPKALLLFELVKMDDGGWWYEKTSIEDPAVIAEVMDTVFKTANEGKCEDCMEFGRKVWLPRIHKMVYGGEYDIVVDRERNVAYFTKKDTGCVESADKKSTPSVKPYQYSVFLDKEMCEVRIHREESNGVTGDFVFGGWKDVIEIENLLFNMSYRFILTEFTKLLTDLHARIPRWRRVMKRLSLRIGMEGTGMPRFLVGQGFYMTSGGATITVGRGDSESVRLGFGNDYIGFKYTPGEEYGAKVSVMKYFQRKYSQGTPKHQDGELYDADSWDGDDFEVEGDMPIERATDYGRQFAEAVLRKAFATGADLEMLLVKLNAVVADFEMRMRFIEQYINYDFGSFPPKAAVKVEWLSVGQFWDEYDEHVRTGRDHPVVNGCYCVKPVSRHSFEVGAMVEDPKGEKRLRLMTWQPGIDYFDACAALRFDDATTLYMLTLPPKKSYSMSLYFVSEREHGID